MTAQHIMPTGRWPSALSARRLFSDGESISFPRPGRHGIFFLLTMASEANAQVLMHLGHNGRLQRISPPGLNLRSRVHEYGGCPYAASDQGVVYCNFSDQRLMSQKFDGSDASEPKALTPPVADATLRYADLLIDSRRQRLIAVREDHRQPTAVHNSLVSIDLQQGGEGEILFKDSDFVAAPTLSADGSMLAFISWNHPSMPWDHSQLQWLQLDASGRATSTQQLPQPLPGALQQPRFSSNGDLYFIADWQDWWNLYCLPASALAQANADSPQCVCPLQAECGVALWSLGVSSFALGDDGSVVLAVNRNSSWQLLLRPDDTDQWQPLTQHFGNIDGLSCHDGAVIFAAAGRDDTAQLWQLNTSTGKMHSLYRCHQPALLPTAAISRPGHISFACDDGEQAYGLFYPPCNPDHAAPDGELPPLVVMVHGGPTGCARPAYNPVIQFWTSRGFAVFDVNHRGSTGYGRRFRHRLYGHWGEIDVADVVAGTRHLIDSGLVDEQRIVIRGGSAGGFVVLAALCRSELFCAGTSYYGVSDLSLLARDTHKFESRYLDQLIGPWPEAEALYRARSPIHQLHRVKAPILLLQGDEDRVVPPNQAEQIFSALKQLQPQSQYIRFAGEGHGFRKPENQIAALEQELSFYLQQL